MQLHVHEWGDAGAPALVCLHGVSAHGRRFRRLAEERLASGFPRSRRECVEEEAREHLVPSPDGLLRWRFSRAAAATIYGELCTEPPPPSALCTPGLLVHAAQFGLVREEQLDEYAR